MRWTGPQRGERLPARWSSAGVLGAHVTAEELSVTDAIGP